MSRPRPDAPETPPPPPPAHHPGDAAPLAWEEAPGAGAWFRTWWRWLAAPGSALAAPIQAGPWRYILFALILHVLVTFLAWTLALNLPGGGWGELQVLEPGVAELALAAPYLVLIINLVGLGYQAVVLQLLLRPLAGVPFTAWSITLRAVCYAQAPHVLAFLGTPGRYVYFFWNLVLIGEGLTRWHGLGRGRAIATVLIWLVLTLFLQRMLPL